MAFLCQSLDPKKGGNNHPPVFDYWLKSTWGCNILVQLRDGGPQLAANVQIVAVRAKLAQLSLVQATNTSHIDPEQWR